MNNTKEKIDTIRLDFSQSEINHIKLKNSFDSLSDLKIAMFSDNKDLKLNVLLDSIKDFSMRYNSDERKILNNKKFLISLEELISLIEKAILTQNKINYCESDDKDSLKDLCQDFINELSYNIFSFEKIDIIKPTEINLRKQQQKNNVQINKINEVRSNKNIINSNNIDANNKNKKVLTSKSSHKIANIPNIIKDKNENKNFNTEKLIFDQKRKKQKSCDKIYKNSSRNQNINYNNKKEKDNKLEKNKENDKNYKYSDNLNIDFKKPKNRIMICAKSQK